MGFGFNLVTSVESIERRPDAYIVEIRLAEGALMSKGIQETRARARSLIATGVIENVGNTARDIGKAIRNTDFDQIERRTEIIDKSERGKVVLVRVDRVQD